MTETDVPLDENEGAKGDTLLAVKLTVARVRLYEVREEGKPYREYLVPARVLNRCARVRVLSTDEEERIKRRLLRRRITYELAC